MNTRRCGKSDLFLPELGIGCWSFGGGKYWGEQTQGDVDNIVSSALDLGCNYFDTAEVYNDGDSEKSLGSALKGRRDKALIGSKVSPHNTAPETLRTHCEASLKRLGTDYIDLYMVHWPIHPHSLRHFSEDEKVISTPPSVHDAFLTLEELQKEGKIRYLGVSNYGVGQLTELLNIDSNIVSNELCYNLLSRMIEMEILPFCRNNGLGVIGYMPLMQGLLTGKYTTLDDIPFQRTRSRHFNGRREGSRHGEEGQEKLLLQTLSQFDKISNESGIPIHQLALSWSIANSDMTCTVNGVRSVKQLEDNVQAVGLNLKKEIVLALNEAGEQLKTALGSSPDLYESKQKSRIR